MSHRPLSPTHARTLILFLAAPFLLAAPLILFPPPLAAQGTVEDYRRAKELPGRYRGAVVGETLEGTWITPTELIFRRVTGPDTWQHVHIDAETGVEGPAFDAEALRALLGDDAPPADRLAIDGWAATETGWLLLLGTRSFVVDRATRAVHEIDSDAERADIPGGLPPVRGARSRDEGGETSILVVNHRDAPITLVWIDRGGEPREYGTVPPGERRRQHTFAGHLWEIRDGETSLGRYRAERGRQRITIDENSTPAPRPEREGRWIGPGHSPDGRTRVFPHDHDLVIRDVEAGIESLLDDSGTPDDRYSGAVHWSPDSTHVVAIRTVPGLDREVTLVESSPRDQLQPKVTTYRYRKPGDAIDRPRPVLFEVATRRKIDIPTDLIEDTWSLTRFDWTTDGSECRFLFDARGHRLRRILAISSVDGSLRTIHEETAETFVDYSQKTFLQWWPDDSACIWMSERSGWSHLYRVDARDGSMSPITQGAWVVAGVEEVDFERGTIEFRAKGVFPGQDPYHVHFGRVNLDGTGLTWWTAGDGTHEIEKSPDGRFIVDTYSRVDLPPVHELRRTSDGGLVAELGRADISRLEELGWQRPERVVAKGRDGTTDIWGVLFRPSNFDPTVRYPAVEQIYAGPHGHHVPKRFSPWHGSQAIAELGFVVGQVDGMGTNGRSKAFHDVCWQNLGDAGFPDRILWWRAAAGTRPFIDLDRVGIYGGSAGGQNAMRALIAHHDFYDVAVADCGCHDNRMDKIWWNEAWMGWPVGPHYEESSNVAQAHRMEGDLLLIVGELDRNVDPASTMQVVDALVRADKDFDLLVIPGAGHGAAGHPYGQRRQADFLVRKLWGVEPRRAP